MTTTDINALFEQFEKSDYKETSYSMIAKAFASFVLSKSGWKPYPGNKPTQNFRQYLVLSNGLWTSDTWLNEKWLHHQHSHVSHWMDICLPDGVVEPGQSPTDLGIGEGMKELSTSGPSPLDLD